MCDSHLFVMTEPDSLAQLHASLRYFREYRRSLQAERVKRPRRVLLTCEERSGVLAKTIARRTNAMIAPTLPYGITGSMEAYPGAFQITESAYRPFIKQILEGLAKNGFKNIIILNGHGGGQTAVLQSVAAEVSAEKHVRTLVINWWSFASDETKEVFGEDGGHAGLNETAFIQAIDATLVHPEKYTGADMTTPYPAPGTWSATPFPSSVGLYQKGQGFPKFDQAKADLYYKKVTDKVANLIIDIVKKWDMAGL